VIELTDDWIDKVTELTDIRIDEGRDTATVALIAERTTGEDNVRIALRIQGVIVEIISIHGITIVTADICIHGITTDIADI
jgi:hypothetical protein